LSVKPVNIERIGNELAIKWDDQTETFLRLEALRRACPCAGCKGEVDVMGNVYKDADRHLTNAAFDLRSFAPVGQYAVNLVWSDGHASVIFSWDYLRQLDAAQKGGSI